MSSVQASVNVPIPTGIILRRIYLVCRISVVGGRGWTEASLLQTIHLERATAVLATVWIYQVLHKLDVRGVVDG